MIRAIIAFSGATIVRHGYYRLPTRVFVVLPNSGHVTNEGALAEFVYPRRQGRGASGSDSKRRKTADTKSKPWTAHFVV